MFDQDDGEIDARIMIENWAAQADGDYENLVRNLARSFRRAVAMGFSIGTNLALKRPTDAALSWQDTSRLSRILRNVVIDETAGAIAAYIANVAYETGQADACGGMLTDKVGSREFEREFAKRLME